MARGLGQARSATMPNRPVGQSARQNRRDEIITKAAQVFDRTGYNRASMDDVAEAVGIAKPTLYHYFRGKEEILFEIHQEFITRLIRQNEARRDAGLSPRQELLEIMGDILDLMETHRGHVRVFFEHIRDLPQEQREVVRGQRDTYHRMVEDALARGIQLGEFRPVDVRMVSLGLFGMCNWAYQWYQSEGPLRPREVAYSMWGLLVYGIDNHGDGSVAES